ncbi:MAG: hypothetical protein ABIR35_01050 [Polaromonas sp.]
MLVYRLPVLRLAACGEQAMAQLPALLRLAASPAAYHQPRGTGQCTFQRTTPVAGQRSNHYPAAAVGLELDLTALANAAARGPLTSESRTLASGTSQLKRRITNWARRSAIA